MGAPPTINLLREIMLVRAITAWAHSLMGAVALVLFFRACYSLYLYSLSQHGACLTGGAGGGSGSLIEHLTGALHWGPVNFLILIGCLFN